MLCIVLYCSIHKTKQQNRKTQRFSACELVGPPRSQGIDPRYGVAPKDLESKRNML